MNTVIKNEFLTAEISTDGGELVSLKNKDGLELMWQADPKIWARHSPVLFPFICSTDSKKFTVNGTEFKMSNHGFARDSVFAVSEATETKAVMKLVSDEKTRTLYPYEFEFMASYELSGNSLIVDYIAVNKDTKEMYCFIGGHPGFNCPFDSSETFDDYYIEYEKNENIIQELPDGRKNTILTDENKLSLSRELFADDVIMKDKPNSSSVSLVSAKSGRSVKVSYSADGCIAVWSPYKENADFVCLEPWMSVPVYCDKTEELTEMPHAKKLAVGESCDFRFVITADV